MISEDAMIRYQLRSPASHQTQRDEAVIWLNARYLDERTQLHIDGAPALVAAIRAALDQAQGRWGRKIAEWTRPADVDFALHWPIMRPFEPLLLEGQDVLAHRQPPDATPNELVDKLARILAEELIVLPVSPIDRRSYEGEGTVRTFAERLFEWSYWRPTHPSAEAASLDLAPRLQSAATAAIDDLTDSLARYDEQCRKNGEPTEGVRLLRWPVDPAQWLPIAREIVAAFDAASDADPVALTHDFQRRMAQLRIGR